DITGRKAIDPKILIKIILFGYSRGLISSRSLERACKENITFMALSCDQKPDHSTIAAFVQNICASPKPYLDRYMCFMGNDRAVLLMK
ncbi:MAG: transposase, partial [Thermodesulfobacteriota bacterium]|nr:transposase [Thermodesulfobacteriota bacterium]